MEPLNIVISGKSPEAFDFFTKLSESRHHVYMNEYKNDQPIDLLIIFDEAEPSMPNFINDKTICFCFNPTLSLNLPNLYQCHFKAPAEGEMQNHSSFVIDTEVHSVNGRFTQIYGALISIGYEISFNESRNAVFEHILAASSLRTQQQQQQSNNHQEEAVVATDPKNTQFHLIIALDCTGSMSSAIRNIKQSLSNIVSVIKTEFPKILISFYAFRDYCDPVIIKKTLFEEDCSKIISAIDRERADGGGDTPEAHKTCLAEIKEDIFTKGTEMTNVCFFITDAPPHLNGRSGTYQQEVNALNNRNLGFAADWIALANSLLEDGIQVFSFLTSNYSETTVPMTVMSKLTQGLSFVIPNSTEVFEKQMISIVSNLMNNSTASTVSGIQMLVPEEGYDNILKEQEMHKMRTLTITDNAQIQSAIAETGSLMRLRPTDRGAKRVTITSAELLDTGIIAIRALKEFYKIIQGDESGYTFFDENPKFKFFEKQLKDAKPTKEWISKSSLSCICSMLTISDSFELLNDINEEELEKNRNITKIVETLGNFVIGYPFLFQLNETGKFNMQDAWPIIFKDASTAYTMSISSLYHILTTIPDAGNDSPMINKFKDFVASKERSGIVPIVPDELTRYALKILDITKWLDALVSYGLHRHIEPLPSITRATGCAFIINIARQAFFSRKDALTASQAEALKLVSQTLFSLIPGCETMMKEFKDSIEKKAIPYNAYSPQEPFNCSTINKIVNCFLQLRRSIKDADRDYMNSFFKQAVSEAIALFAQFLKADEKEGLMSMIFDDIPVNVDKIEEMNPLEVADPLEFKAFVAHEIENHKVNKMCAFIFRAIWQIIRDDEFESPSNLEQTAALALAIAAQTRSFKYKMIEKEDDNNNDNENSSAEKPAGEEKKKDDDDDDDADTTTKTTTAAAAEKKDEKPQYEINPLFATQDPNQLLQLACYIFFTEKKKEAIKNLQANRKKFLIEKCIDQILVPFKSCNYDDFFLSLISGFKLEWMKEPFRLDVLQTPTIVAQLFDEVKQPAPNNKAFYESAFYVLFLGHDKEERKWAVDTCRDIKLAQSFVAHFLENDKEVFQFYLDNRQRALPNRHGHNPMLCPNQDEYTEEYARKRITCNMAPFYFFPEMPKKMKRFDLSLIKHLAHKKNAPDEREIFQLALKIKKEIQTANPDCEKPPALKPRSKRRRKCFKPKRH